MSSLTGVLASCLLAVVCSVSLVDAASPLASLPRGESDYLQNCGGCHGIQGRSAEPQVPQLAGRVGQFLCGESGRGYLVKLPNVAFASLEDAKLADLINYVVFELGGASVPGGTSHYSAEEVRRLRKWPLKNQPLALIRERVLAESRCPGAGAPGQAD